MTSTDTRMALLGSVTFSTKLIKSVVSLRYEACYWLNKVVNKMTSVFQVANCFHPIHLQLETLTDNFDKQF